MTDEEWTSFERCWEYLEPAVEHYLPTHAKRHVQDAVEGAHAQLWPLPNSAVITKIEEHPTGLKLCRIWLAGGMLEEIRQFAPFLRDWAKSQGCKGLIYEGRPGWGRVFGDLRKIAETWIEDIK